MPDKEVHGYSVSGLRDVQGSAVSGETGYCRRSEVPSSLCCHALCGGALAAEKSLSAKAPQASCVAADHGAGIMLAAADLLGRSCTCD